MGETRLTNGNNVRLVGQSGQNVPEEPENYAQHQHTPRLFGRYGLMRNGGNTGKCTYSHEICLLNPSPEQTVTVDEFYYILERECLVPTKTNSSAYLLKISIENTTRNISIHITLNGGGHETYNRQKRAQ